MSFVGCNQRTNVAALSETEDVDSLAIQLHRLDSIYNSGSLLHMEMYKLAKLKSIEISVYSIGSGEDTFEYINLRKDCGGTYYYDWEDARILVSEVKNLINAVDEIKANLHRETDHEERYAYLTEDDIRLLAKNNGGGSTWTVTLSVDYNKSDAEITLSEAELDKFVEIVNQGVAKIQELNK